jgi:hypothetical protein
VGGEMLGGEMFALLLKVLLVARTRLKSEASLEAENIVLRQQVNYPQPQGPIAGAAAKHRSADPRLVVPILPHDSECDHRGQA